MTIQLDITNACNLTCSHCYHPHHSNFGSLSLIEWQAILKQIEYFLKKFGFFPRFVFCGGEPLLSPYLKTLIQNINEKWPQAEIIILTNGTVYKESIFKFLNPETTGIQVSLDGPNEYHHDLVRGKGSFKKSLVGIERMLNDGHEVSTLSILSRRTATWVPEFFDLAKKIGVSSQNFTRLIAQGHGKELISTKADSALTGLDLKSAMSQIIIESFRTGVPTNTHQPLFALIDKTFGQNSLFGFDAIIIDYKGNLKATSRAELILGNLKHEKLESVYLHNKVLNDVRDRKVETCGKCELYEVCGGDRNAAYAEFGRFTARDPGCWK